MNQSEFKTLLQANDILRADCVGSPKCLVEVFTIPTAEFSSTVIDVIERPQALNHALDLPKLPDVTTCIERLCYIGANREPDFIRLVGNVGGHDVMPSLAQVGHDPRAYGTQTPCD